MRSGFSITFNFIPVIVPEEDIIRNGDYNPKSLLVLNTKGRLRTMPIPLRVCCKFAAEDIPVKTWVVVEEVLMTRNDGFAYVVNGKPYYHGHFEILLKLD